ncbi:aspartate--tRNA ligase, mitochondrial-like isoform X2 [Corticium candelabrum]|uniref:aspartate--tRNA ligase, mitochondrial-like isoform X2 n=1 Tax=Corticium candelabrum TaxID=121492 RepID=UPI002E269669|nr:aspartate--tRNA ligase, mitochondrial-like isoform X2 [Corticium candelabrum]
MVVTLVCATKRFAAMTRIPNAFRVLIKNFVVYSQEEVNRLTWRTHTCGGLRMNDNGERVKLCGWVSGLRKMGSQGPLFIPLRDAYGTTQLIATDKETVRRLADLPLESVICIDGEVQTRPEKMRNEDMETGDVEVNIHSYFFINKAAKLPFEISRGSPQATEMLRLEHRHLDLRRDKLQANLRFRSHATMAIRNFLTQRFGFIEVETPTLFRPTPQGSREFIVQTRLPGKYYALPQSPQQASLSSC